MEGFSKNEWVSGPENGVLAPFQSVFVGFFVVNSLLIKIFYNTSYSLATPYTGCYNAVFLL